MKKSWITGLLLAGVGLTIAGAALVLRSLPSGPTPAGELKTVTEFRDDKPLPPFRLDGPNGAVTQDDLQGKWSFVFFGYTQCPDICPTALSLMKHLKTIVGAGGTAFQVVFISLDPKRDTRELLDQYMAAFDPAFIGLRGDDAALQPLLKDLGVFFQRNDAKDARNYTVDHSAAIYLIGPKGSLRAVFSPPQKAESMAADFWRITTSK
jgi:protein SCO1/2